MVWNCLKIHKTTQYKVSHKNHQVAGCTLIQVENYKNHWTSWYNNLKRLLFLFYKRFISFKIQSLRKMLSNSTSSQKVRALMSEQSKNGYWLCSFFCQITDLVNLLEGLDNVLKRRFRRLHDNENVLYNFDLSLQP